MTGTNALVTMSNSIGDGAINGAEQILAWPVGYVVAFVLGLSLVGLAVFAIRKFMG